MTHRTPAQIVTRATSALVRDCDVTDTLASLLSDCADVLSVSDGGETELLSSTSHAIAELELFQIQQATGPCIDAITGNTEITAVGSAGILERWPEVGRRIVEAGYLSVHASPLRWHGKILGAMNAFFADEVTLTTEQTLLAQAFADVATVVVMKGVLLESNEVGAQVRAALAGRTVVEQAKGVIAQQQGLDMASAYDVLVTMADENGASLSAIAGNVVHRAQHESRAT